MVFSATPLFCSICAFYTVATASNGVSLARGVDVHQIACTSGTKCPNVYREQTAGPRSANFFAYMHADMVRAPANFFYPNRRRRCHSFSRENIRIEYIEVHTWLSLKR